MLRSELIEKLAESRGIPEREARQLVKKYFDSIETILKEEGRLELRGFGIFELREREPRKGRIPGTGEKVDVPARTVPAFKSGKYLREAVRGEDD